MRISAFRGINNVADRTRLAPGELHSAVNLDIESTGNMASRLGRTKIQNGAAHSPFEAPFGLLVVTDNDLVLLDRAGAMVRVVYDTIGYTRVWYVQLPDGRVAFSNGLINGIATADATYSWGVERPIDPGVGIPGGTPYMVTHVRDADGFEGPPTYGTENIDTAQAIIGLPVRPGHTTNVYFAPDGGAMFLAGNTATDSFQHNGAALTAQHLGGVLDVPPPGTLLYAWNSRILIADGTVAWATSPMRPELCAMQRDFIQMPAEITLFYSSGDGVFVGTTEGMYFLAGQVLSKLKAQSIASGYVTRGSGVEIDLSYLNEKVRPSGFQQGTICLLDGAVHLIYGGGQIIPLSAGRYHQRAEEVYATARLRDGCLQYLAAPV